MDTLLAHAGCTSRMLVTGDSRALLGGTLDLAAQPFQAAVGATAARLVRDAAPGARADVRHAGRPTGGLATTAGAARSLLSTPCEKGRGQIGAPRVSLCGHGRVADGPNLPPYRSHVHPRALRPVRSKLRRGQPSSRSGTYAPTARTHKAGCSCAYPPPCPFTEPSRPPPKKWETPMRRRTAGPESTPSPARM